MRRGDDAEIPPEIETRIPRHTQQATYREMLLQICRDYPGLPDARSLTLAEIRFFYEGLRAELKEATKPRAKK